MTEDQIERWYEREMDALDAALMNGVLSQKEYDKASKELTQEVNEMYRAHQDRASGSCQEVPQVRGILS